MPSVTPTTSDPKRNRIAKPALSPAWEAGPVFVFLPHDFLRAAEKRKAPPSRRCLGAWGRGSFGFQGRYTKRGISGGVPAITADWASNPYSSRNGSHGSWYGTRSRRRWAASWRHRTYTCRTDDRRFPGSGGRCCEHRSRGPSCAVARGFPASGRGADGSC